MTDTERTQVAVVTAAASGMGRESSLRLAGDGIHVVLADIDTQAGEQVRHQIVDAGGSAEFHAVDMTDVSQILNLAKAVTDQHSAVDVLFNHAGAAGPRAFDFDEQSWCRSVSINLTAPVFLTQALMDPLRASGHASVIFTSSVSGLLASRNSPVYSTVKSGVIGFMRALAAVAAPDGIRSNAIAPGTIETPMLQTFFRAEGESQELMDERLAAFKTSIPLGRIGTPSEVADLVQFLASDKSSFITGVTIPIDGGYAVV